MATVVENTYPEKFSDVLEADSIHEVTQGSLNTKQYVVTHQSHSTGSVTPSNTSFNVNFGQSQIIDKNVFLRASIICSVTCAGTAAANTGIINTMRGLSLACLPLHRVMNQLNVRVNNTSLSVQPWQLTSALVRLQDDIEMRRLNSLSPCQPDSYNTMYAASIAGGAVVDGDGIPTKSPPVNGSANSPYADEASAGYSYARSLFKPKSVTHVANVNNTTAESFTLEYELCELLQHPFFNSLPTDEGTIGRVSNLAVDIAWNNLQAMFSNSEFLMLDGSAAPNGISLNFAMTGFTGNAELLLTTYSPTVEIPKVVKSHFFDVVSRNFNITGCATAGATGSVSTGAIRLTQVPHKIVLFARPRTPFTDAVHVDAHLALTQLTMRTDKDSGIFANATQQQLFNISVQSGLDMNFKEWSRDVGSIFVCDVTEGFMSGMLAGVRQEITIEITANFLNTQYERFFHGSQPDTTHAGTVAGGLIANWDLQVLFYMSAVLSSDGSISTLNQGIDAMAASAAIQASAPMPSSKESANGYANYGGGFWGNVGKWSKKAFRKGWKVVSPYANKYAHNVLDQGIQAASRMAGVPVNGIRASGLRVLA